MSKIVQTTIQSQPLNRTVPMWYREDVFHHSIQPDQPIDLIVADEVIRRDGYKLGRLFDAGFKPATVLDLGANVGIFGAFAFHLWQPKVFAVEPLGDDVLMRLNVPEVRIMCVLAGGGFPIELIQQFAHIKTAVACMEILTLEEIMERFNLDNVDLLKVDIEGAEKELFATAAKSRTLSRIRCCVGEWHGESARQALILACKETHFLLTDYCCEDRGTFISLRL